MYCFGDHAQNGSVEAKFPIGYRGIARLYGTTKLEGTRLSYRSQRNKTKRPEENCVGHLSLIPPCKFLLPTLLGDSALHEQQYFYGQQYSNGSHTKRRLKIKNASESPPPPQKEVRKRKQDGENYVLRSLIMCIINFLSMQSYLHIKTYLLTGCDKGLLDINFDFIQLKPHGMKGPGSSCRALH
jgi:hypothetical protein